MLDVEVRERAGTNRISRRKTYSLHLQNGSFLEGGWDNAYYTREWNCPPNGPPAEGIQVIIMPPNQSEPGGAGEFGVAASMAAVANAYARATGTVPTGFPINHNQPLGFTPLPTVPPIPQSPTDGLEEAFWMATHTFILDGEQVSVECADELRLLWVLRDLLGIHGPKYGCGLDVCKACTCRINGKAFNPCSVPVSDIQPTDGITTIEGLPATVSQPLHSLRNVCRCGTYPRIRAAIVEAAASM